jgi:hypothetical protein
MYALTKALLDRLNQQPEAAVHWILARMSASQAADVDSGKVPWPVQLS